MLCEFKITKWSFHKAPRTLVVYSRDYTHFSGFYIYLMDFRQVCVLGGGCVTGDSSQQVSLIKGRT